MRTTVHDLGQYGGAVPTIQRRGGRTTPRRARPPRTGLVRLRASQTTQSFATKQGAGNDAAAATGAGGTTAGRGKPADCATPSCCTPRLWTRRPAGALSAARTGDRAVRPPPGARAWQSGAARRTTAGCACRSAATPTSSTTCGGPGPTARRRCVEIEPGAMVCAPTASRATTRASTPTRSATTSRWRPRRPRAGCRRAPVDRRAGGRSERPRRRAAARRRARVGQDGCAVAPQGTRA